MDFRIIELADTIVYGVSGQYEGQGYKTREELRHSMWANNCDDVPGQLCEGGWNQPGSTSYDGVWYGIWQDGKYMIAREKADVKTLEVEARTLPAGTYAAFKTECGGLAWEEFPKLFELIFDSWLPPLSTSRNMISLSKSCTFGQTTISVRRIGTMRFGFLWN